MHPSIGRWLVLSAVLLLAGCHKKPSPGERPALNELHEKIVANNNELAAKLYDQLRRQPGNLVLSPYGVSSALDMVLEGADGRTRDELLAALGGSADIEPQLHQAHCDLRRWLAADQESRGFRLDLAAAQFIQRDTEVLDSFLKALETHHQGSVQVVDFANQPATARKVINDWAAEATHNKIRNVIAPDDIDEQTKLILAQAIYFKGSWERAFEASNTTKEPFHVSADNSVDVDMMRQSEKFGFAHTDGVRVLAMPYRGELSMVLVLPDKNDGLAEVEERLEAPTLARWTTAASENVEKLDVAIPKFKFDDAHNLTQALSAMGIATVFDANAADLSRIDGVRPTSAVNRLYVDGIRQQAMIDVNEEGTEAAAVTTTKSETSKYIERPSFTADHPFLFFIRENETGLILFLGRVVDPTGK